MSAEFTMPRITGQRAITARGTDIAVSSLRAMSPFDPLQTLVRSPIQLR